MIQQWRDRSRQFGIVAFGLLGFAFGLLKTVQWSSEGLFLMRGLMAKIVWACVVASASAAFGYFSGPMFVRNASRKAFVKAAEATSFALVCAIIITVFLYCATLVVTGDFGVSLGVFGLLKPPYSILQKLMATVVIFFTGIWLNILGAIVDGFIGGFLVALIFSPPYS
jgi:hypothetical protein